jgi:excisionase family DNA binding protein
VVDLEKHRRESGGRLTYQEAAKLTEVGLETIRKWISRGVRGIKLQKTRIGGRCFILREHLDQFISDINSPNPAQAKTERRRHRFSERTSSLRKRGLEALARAGLSI